MFGFGGWEGCQRFGPHRLYILAKSLQLPQNLPEIRISHLNFACSATLLENFIRVSKSTPRDFHFFVSAFTLTTRVLKAEAALAAVFTV